MFEFTLITPILFGIPPIKAQNDKSSRPSRPPGYAYDWESIFIFY